MLLRMLLLFAGFATAALSGCETIPARVSGEPIRTVAAIRYRVVVGESALELAQGGGDTIEELFVPEFGICFNRAGGSVHAFFRAKDRRKEPNSKQTQWAYDYREEIQIPRELAKAMRDLATVTKAQRELAQEWSERDSLKKLIRPVENPND